MSILTIAWSMCGTASLMLALLQLLLWIKDRHNTGILWAVAISRRIVEACGGRIESAPGRTDAGPGRAGPATAFTGG